MAAVNYGVLSAGIAERLAPAARELHMIDVAGFCRRNCIMKKHILQNI